MVVWLLLVTHLQACLSQERMLLHLLSQRTSAEHSTCRQHTCQGKPAVVKAGVAVCKVAADVWCVASRRNLPHWQNVDQYG